MKLESIIEIMKSDKSIKTISKFMAPDSVIRVSRRINPRKSKSRAVPQSETFIVTLGKPNYEARQFIKLCKQAGEPFPVKRPQIKRYPIKGKINVSKSKIHLP